MCIVYVMAFFGFYNMQWKTDVTMMQCECAWIHIHFPNNSTCIQNILVAVTTKILSNLPTHFIFFFRHHFHQNIALLTMCFFTCFFFILFLSLPFCNSFFFYFVLYKYSIIYCSFKCILQSYRWTLFAIWNVFTKQKENIRCAVFSHFFPIVLEIEMALKFLGDNEFMSNIFRLNKYDKIKGNS